jgi:hypothetical protein
MNKYIYPAFFLCCALVTGCADNKLDEDPKDSNFPFRLIVDAEEGGDLPDAEDYDLEITFADYTGELPAETITVGYTISDLEDDMTGNVAIDKIVYEVELDDCTYERELDFTPAADGLSGTITIAADPDLGSVPESFEVVFTLPGADETEGTFTFELHTLESTGNVILGFPATFEYEVLDNDVAGEWALELEDEAMFEAFKEVFAPLNSELDALDFADITGTVKAEFEYGEMKFVVELAEEEEVTTCEDGETETEMVNKEIEIEADYDAEDGEVELEGSHFITGDDGEVEDELDFTVEAEYETNEVDETVTFTFFKVIDEDNFQEGEELFRKDTGFAFTFFKD